MFKHAFVLMSLLGAVVACGDPEPSNNADAAPGADATQVLPDAVPEATIVSEQTEAEWIALCEELYTPEVTFASQAVSCSTRDCDASNTAVEDCIAQVVAEPQDCTPPAVGNPLRDCDATVDQLKNCLDVVFGQLLPYGTATCATVDDIPPLVQPNGLPECDALLAKCPDIFAVVG